MRFVDWVKREIGDRASALEKKDHFSSQADVRARFVPEQRILAERWEKRAASLQKRLMAMVARIRASSGSLQDISFLEAEQRHVQRLLDRLEVSDTDTVELLREWRDWMRAFRQGVAYDGARVELIGSELRLRGVIDEEEVVGSGSAHPRSPAAEQGSQDSFSEWDQYLGERLPGTKNFWEKRVEEMRAQGVHDTVLHGFVKQMKHAHGHANVWRRMQDR